MSLGKLIQDMAALAIETVEDTLDKVTYVRVTDIAQYDSATDTYTVTEDTFPNITVVPIRPRQDQDDYQHIESDNLKVIVAHKHLGFHPSNNDYYIDASGSKFEIQQIKSIPSRAIYILTVRNP